MARYTYPHVIENGAGERLTFMRRVTTPDGDRVEGDTVVQPGAGPLMHVHHLQEEVFTVREGRIGWQRAGEPERFAGPGETIVFEAGAPHRFWNAGNGMLRCDAHFAPAHNTEYLLTELFASSRRNGGKRPDLFDLAFLMRRYRREFTTLAIPVPVQRVVFPLLVAIGTALGRYHKYDDAPEPVRR
jgi:mannose-6-phosphate isomerase-like protein (cupin superfamily)